MKLNPLVILFLGFTLQFFSLSSLAAQEEPINPCLENCSKQTQKCFHQCELTLQERNAYCVELKDQCLIEVFRKNTDPRVCEAAYEDCLESQQWGYQDCILICDDVGANCVEGCPQSLISCQ